MPIQEPGAPPILVTFRIFSAGLDPATAAALRVRMHIEPDQLDDMQDVESFKAGLISLLQPQ